MMKLIKCIAKFQITEFQVKLNFETRRSVCRELYLDTEDTVRSKERLFF